MTLIRCYTWTGGLSKNSAILNSPWKCGSITKSKERRRFQIQVPPGAVFDAIRVQRRSFWEAILPDVSIKNERQSQLIQEPVSNLSGPLNH